MYIKLGDKKYQLPDSITIGRGEPFDINDRSLARAHAKLTYKAGKWKILDLGTDTGISINGSKIKSGKYKTVTLEDKITLGSVPLELFETMEASEYAGIRKIVSRNARNYRPLIYGILFVAAAIVVFSKSQGNHVSDGISLVLLAAILKLMGVFLRMGRGYFFPFKIIHEVILGSDGITLSLSDKSNFSLRFHSIKKWHLVGKCFFIDAYGKDLRFMMLEDHHELERILVNKCLGKRRSGHVLFSCMGLIPLFGALAATGLLLSFDGKIPTLIGHTLGAVSVMGLMTYLFIEDLRELMPFPWKLSRLAQSSLFASVIAVTLVTQFNQVQGNRQKANLFARISGGLKHEKQVKSAPVRLPASASKTE